MKKKVLTVLAVVAAAIFIFYFILFLTAQGSDATEPGQKVVIIQKQ